MEPADQLHASSQAPTDLNLHLVCGAGGSRAILGSAGAILACHIAGINKFRTIGGASGGSIPTLLLAGGLHPTKIARLLIEINFSKLLTRHAMIFRVFLAYILKDNYYLVIRPRKGLLSAEKVGDFLQGIVPCWPENYWTVATAGDSQWLFTAQGVYQYNLQGVRRRICECPAPVGVAIQATSAIPGVFDAIQFHGRYLIDGALTVDGRTPIGAVQRHFGAKPGQIISVDVGEDPVAYSWPMRLLTRLIWKYVIGRHCPNEGKLPIGHEGTILMQPEDMWIQALEFAAVGDLKWQALMRGFICGVEALVKAGYLTGTRLNHALAICRSFEHIQSTALLRGHIAERTEKLLTRHGLY